MGRRKARLARRQAVREEPSIVEIGRFSLELGKGYMDEPTLTVYAGNEGVLRVERQGYLGPQVRAYWAPDKSMSRDAFLDVLVEETVALRDDPRNPLTCFRPDIGLFWYDEATERGGYPAFGIDSVVADPSIVKMHERFGTFRELGASAEFFCARYTSAMSHLIPGSPPEYVWDPQSNADGSMPCVVTVEVVDKLAWWIPGFAARTSGYGDLALLKDCADKLLPR